MIYSKPWDFSKQWVTINVPMSRLLSSLRPKTSCVSSARISCKCPTSFNLEESVSMDKRKMERCPFGQEIWAFTRG